MSSSSVIAYSSSWQLSSLPSLVKFSVLVSHLVVSWPGNKPVIVYRVSVVVRPVGIVMAIRIPIYRCILSILRATLVSLLFIYIFFVWLAILVFLFIISIYLGISVCSFFLILFYLTLDTFLCEDINWILETNSPRC